VSASAFVRFFADASAHFVAEDEVAPPSLLEIGHVDQICLLKPFWLFSDLGVPILHHLLPDEIEGGIE